MYALENAEKCQILHVIASDPGLGFDFTAAAEADLMRHQVSKAEVLRMLRRATVEEIWRDALGRVPWAVSAFDLDMREFRVECYVDRHEPRITVKSVEVVE